MCGLVLIGNFSWTSWTRVKRSQAGIHVPYNLGLQVKWRFDCSRTKDSCIATITWVRFQGSCDITFDYISVSRFPVSILASKSPCRLYNITEWRHALHSTHITSPYHKQWKTIVTHVFGTRSVSAAFTLVCSSSFRHKHSSTRRGC